MYLAVIDTNEIKKRENLATSKTTVRIVVELGAVHDMNSNAVNALSLVDNVAPDVFIKDAVKPILLSSTLNLTSETLSLTFDETVNCKTLVVENHVTLEEPSGEAFGLTGTTTDVLALSFDTICTFILKTNDQNGRAHV